MNTPKASFYVTLLGCSPMSTFILVCSMVHNCNFDMAQLMTRLSTIMSVMKVIEDNPEWNQTHTRYLVDRLKLLGYKGNCKVKNIKLGVVWRQCVNEAEKILAVHPNIGREGSIGIFDQLFVEGATFLKPKGRSLQKTASEEKDVSMVEEEVPETRPKGPPTADQPPTPTNRQPPPTANHQPPPTAANRQRRPTANRQPLPTATNHQSPTTHCRQPPPTATYRQLLTANRQSPPTANHQHRSLVPKAAVQAAVPKWSSRRDTRKCTKRPPSNPAGEPSK